MHSMNEKNGIKKWGSMLALIIYDTVFFVVLSLLMLVVYKGEGALSGLSVVMHAFLAALCIFGSRIIWKIYQQIWRYGGIQCYIRLLISDTMGSVLLLVLQNFVLESIKGIDHLGFPKTAALCAINLLCSLSIRMMYRFAYKCGSRNTPLGKLMRFMLKVVTFGRIVTHADTDNHKINIAILGAGKLGVELAEDLWAKNDEMLNPRCFIDGNPEKIGRDIHGVSVLGDDENVFDELREMNIQEVVFAVTEIDRAKKLEMFERYKNAGFNIKAVDFVTSGDASGKRQLKDFSIEDLLMREPKQIINDKTRAYYKEKKILITGGGGSIGSELCRQLAQMEPKQIIVVGIYENCAYELLQSIKLAYKNTVDVRVEIASIANKPSLARVFEEYRPDICINAAAHKHVPLMEKNCIEAVENNVFGALNVVELCEEYGCKRFMMVSTDKAVNPTNVMGATKRLGEMIMSAFSQNGKVKCSATRFGNVLGSAGSVIPIFRRQIAAGGPVTLTDKRIIRYFMTITEASQLILVGGALAVNGDLFVLDMGKPVKIYDLARNMIRLSGAEDIEIIETGLRPGEKLYEELLVKSETLTRTENDLIFVEHDEPVAMQELNNKLDMLRKACLEGNNDKVREVLRKVVPTFKTPEEVNSNASEVLKTVELNYSK